MSDHKGPQLYSDKYRWIAKSHQVDMEACRHDPKVRALLSRLSNCSHWQSAIQAMADFVVQMAQRNAPQVNPVQQQVDTIQSMRQEGARNAAAVRAKMDAASG